MRQGGGQEAGGPRVVRGDPAQAHSAGTALSVSRRCAAGWGMATTPGANDTGVARPSPALAMAGTVWSGLLSGQQCMTGAEQLATVI